VVDVPTVVPSALMKSIEFIDLNLPLTLDKPWMMWRSAPNQIPSSHGSLQLPESRQAA
jgi:hypothetical protein